MRYKIISHAKRGESKSKNTISHIVLCVYFVPFDVRLSREDIRNIETHASAWPTLGTSIDYDLQCRSAPVIGSYNVCCKKSEESFDSSTERHIASYLHARICIQRYSYNQIKKLSDYSAYSSLHILGGSIGQLLRYDRSAVVSPTSPDYLVNPDTRIVLTNYSQVIQLTCYFVSRLIYLSGDRFRCYRPCRHVPDSVSKNETEAKQEQVQRHSRNYPVMPIIQLSFYDHRNACLSVK